MHPIHRLFLLAFVALFAAGCASNKPADGAGDDLATEEGVDELGDLLISFTVRAQARDYDALLDMVSETDRSKLMESDGTIRKELLPGLRNLKVSTLQAENVSVMDGKLVGIADVIAEAARRVSASAEQRVAPAPAPTAAPAAAPVIAPAPRRAPAVAPVEEAPAALSEPATSASSEGDPLEQDEESDTGSVEAESTGDESSAGDPAADEGFPE